jgi:hypothetical protein
MVFWDTHGNAFDADNNPLPTRVFRGIDLFNFEGGIAGLQMHERYGRKHYVDPGS